MDLAQRLNELAIANSQGLLNDDEYRLLRQNLFEQHSSSVILPKENPVVPVTRVHAQMRGTSPGPVVPSPSPRRSAHRPTPEPARAPPSPSRPKNAVTTGMANLLRKATGRKMPTPANDPPTTRDLRKGSGTSQLAGPSDPPTPKRSALLPRMLYKKHAEIPPLRTDVSSRPSYATSSATVGHATGYYASDYAVPSSPSSSNFSGSLISPVQYDNTFSSIHDVFDDDNLHTAKDIRSAITATEDEGRRLVEAFNDLEANTIRRIQKQRARRLPTTTPANVNVLLEGREWRTHRLVTSPSSPRLDTKTHSHHRHIASSLERRGSDVASIRSGSSNYTSLSHSKSIASLPKHPSSPLSATFRMPSIMRKSSISSVSSHTPSVSPSSGTLGVNTHARGLSRSTSQLGLRTLKGSSALASTETIGGANPDPPEYNDDAELSDIRQRREDLVARYQSRVEFLRAKLRGAELHEKLLRK
ncbi:hypothetical protein BJ912DRAFT_1066806 [Pholiota molesta]|nr:hypothetical protein BJ912DRAFT_1066806 [Pholiota molesta]